MSATTIARQPKGVPVGGQFAATARTEADIDLEDDPDEDACSECGGDLSDNEGYDGKCGSCADAAYSTELVTDMIEELATEDFDLVHVEYDDKLTPEQVSAALAGKWTDVEESVEEVFGEQRADRAREIAQERFNDAGGYWDDLDEEQQQGIVDAILERDTSDPVGDLMRQTPPQLMRTSLGKVARKVGRGAKLLEDRTGFDDNAYTQRCAAITSTLTAHGVNTDGPGVRAAISELVADGPYHWHDGVELDVIWTGDITTAMARPLSDAGSPDATTNTLTFTDPHLLLIDRVNGSGQEVRLPGQLRKVIPRNTDEADLPRTQRVYLDSAAGGYSWDKVVGLVRGAYRTDVTGQWT